MGFPSISTSPLLAGNTFIRIRIEVVLPAPFLPSKPKAFPPSAIKLTPLRTSFSPKDFDNKDYAASPVDTSKDGHGQDLLDWTRQTNEDDVITLVRDIVSNMSDPCKSIFRYIYYGDDGKRMSVKDIMAKMPQYTSEASVRNQTSRCNKKFKETFMKLRNLL